MECDLAVLVAAFVGMLVGFGLATLVAFREVHEAGKQAYAQGLRHGRKLLEAVPKP